MLLRNRVDESPFTETTHELDYGVLQFAAVTGSERGQYICTATNSVGTTTATVELSVRGTRVLIAAVNGLIVSQSISHFICPMSN